MNDLRTALRGLWLPLVTPFRDGAARRGLAAAAGARTMQRSD